MKKSRCSASNEGEQGYGIRGVSSADKSTYFGGNEKALDSKSKEIFYEDGLYLLCMPICVGQKDGERERTPPIEILLRSPPWQR